VIYADLVTLDEAKAALYDLDDTQGADLAACISAVSQHISARYKRAMAATVVTEERELGMNRTMRLNWKPIIQVLKVEADQVPLITVTNAGPATEAMVTLNVTGEADALVSTGITLSSTTAGVAAAPVVLNWTDYPTAGQLAAQVNTLPGGWGATVPPAFGEQPDLGAMPTAGILPDQGGKSALRSGCQLWSYSRVLNDWTLTGGKLVVFEWRSAGYQFPDKQWGADNRTTRFRVTYRAGNVTVPADVKRACILTVHDVLDRTQIDGGISDLKADDYATVIDRIGGLTGIVKAMLSRYMDRGL
jgi:hypothetical protein